MDRLLLATFRAEQHHFWFRGFRRFVRPMLQAAAAGLHKPTLLDCGCGTGANLSLLTEIGPSIGFDLTMVGLQFARERDHARVARASVTHAPFADASFDIVTSFDVLYCLPDDLEQAAIREMYRLLRPGGAAVVNVAALRLLKGDHSVLGGEVRRYSRRELRESLERGGFAVERLTYTNAAILPLVAGVRLLQRFKGFAASADEAEHEIRVPPAPVNMLLSGVLAAESWALRLVNMPLGSSLLCLARKPVQRTLQS